MGVPDSDPLPSLTRLTPSGSNAGNESGLIVTRVKWPRSVCHPDLARIGQSLLSIGTIDY